MIAVAFSKYIGVMCNEVLKLFLKSKRVKSFANDHYFCSAVIVGDLVLQQGADIAIALIT